MCLATRYGSSTRSSAQHYGVGAGKWACLGDSCSNYTAGEFAGVVSRTEFDDWLRWHFLTGVGAYTFIVLVQVLTSGQTEEGLYAKTK